jgi:hypothetical protein
MGAVEVAQDERTTPDERGRKLLTGGAVGAQGGDRVVVDVDHAGLAGLGRAFDELLAGALALHQAGAPPDLQPARVQVGVPPPQGQRLTAAHPGDHQQPPAHSQARVMVFRPALKADELGGRPCLHLRRASDGLGGSAHLGC